MDKIKNYCPVHHYYYTGDECPFCREERIKSLDKKFNRDGVVENKGKRDTENTKDREITSDDLEKLVNKFKR
jgi:hypothetical protein